MSKKTGKSQSKAKSKSWSELKAKALLSRQQSTRLETLASSPSLPRKSVEPVIGDDGYYKFPFQDIQLEKYFIAKKTKAGYVTVRIEAECDVQKRDPIWHKKQMLLMGLKDYRREHRLDWTSAAGDVYYSEFVNNPGRYVDPDLDVQKEAVVYRGWDFGMRRPACIFSQVVKGELRVIREVMPENIDSHSLPASLPEPLSAFPTP